MSQSTVLTCASPVRLADHFTVPPDDTDWPGCEYQRCVSKNGKSAGVTPRRAQATFQRHHSALVPTSDYGRSMEDAFGVYILTFEVPRSALYIGIAAACGRRPEGVLVRLRKHRVKVTGSRVGANPAANGGVSHTEGWRPFAVERYEHFRAQNGFDTCADARICVGTLTARSGAPKSWLEYFENRIKKDAELSFALVRALWPEQEGLQPYLLTTRTSQGEKPPMPVIRLWTGELWSVS